MSCRFSEHYYSLKFLEEAELLRVPVDDRTKSWTLFGGCSANAALVLEGPEVTLFGLAKERTCAVSLLDRTHSFGPGLEDKLNSRNFWESLQQLPELLEEYQPGCIVTLLPFEGGIAAVAHSPHGQAASLFYDGHTTRIPFFLTHRYGSYDYVAFVFETWHQVGYAAERLYIAGDAGVVTRDTGVVSYTDFSGSQASRQVCNRRRMLERFRSLPAEVVPNTLSDEEYGYDEILKSLARYRDRNIVRAFSFGC